MEPSSQSKILAEEARAAFTIVMTLTQTDVESIGTGDDTPAAHAFAAYVEKYSTLAACGKEHAFWSGMEARKHAAIERRLWKDADCPFVSRLFALCAAAREAQGGAYDPSLTLASYAISRAHASIAHGTAHVYISSDKPTEAPGLTPGNNFCEAELPVLRTLARRGLVDDVLVYTRGFDGAWTMGVSLFDSALDLPIWRRSWHPLDGNEARPSFVEQRMTEAQWSAWRIAPPRRYTTLSFLRRAIAAWRTAASESAARRRDISACT